MGDLSAHFSRSEFACHCNCGYGLEGGDVHHQLVDILELVREYFEEPVKVVSGCRCERHNAAVGGAPDSCHMKGWAADIQVKNTPPARVAEYLERQFPKSLGIGRYRSWVHVDRRPTKARWKK